MAHVWPQLTWLALMGLGLGIHLAKNGQPREDHYGIISQLLVDALLAFLLWSGGFFAPIGLG